LGVIEQAIKLINVVLTFRKMSSESIQIFKELKIQFETDGIKSLSNFNKNFINYLPEIDKHRQIHHIQDY
jgi:hypothetical protein